MHAMGGKKADDALQFSLYDEYAELTAKYRAMYGPNVVVLMEVGSFLEWYGCDKGLGADVPAVCRALGVQQTRRNKSIAQVSRTNPMMGGVTRCAAHRHVRRLVEAGYTVVLAMQQQVQAPGCTSGRLVRCVSEVVSASTLSASAFLSEDGEAGHEHDGGGGHDTCLLMAVHIDRPKANIGWTAVGWALVDLASGRTWAGQCEARDPTRPLDALRRAAHDACPREAVVSFAPHATVTASHDTEAQLTELCAAQLGLHRSMVHLRPASGSPEVQDIVLRRAFPRTGFLTPAEHVDLERLGHALEAFVLVLQFAYEHNESAIERVQRPIVHAAGAACMSESGSENGQEHELDTSPDAMRQLDVLPPAGIHGGGGGGGSGGSGGSGGGGGEGHGASLLRVLNRCRTPPGRRAFRDRLLRPVCGRSELVRRYDAVDAMLSAGEAAREELRARLDATGDLERAFRRVCLRSVQTPRQLAAVAAVFEAAREALDGAADALQGCCLGEEMRAGAAAAGAIVSHISARLDLDEGGGNGCGLLHGAYEDVDAARDELEEARGAFAQAAAAINAAIGAEHVKVLDPTMLPTASSQHISLAITERRWADALRTKPKVLLLRPLPELGAAVGSGAGGGHAGMRRLELATLGHAAAERVSRAAADLAECSSRRLREMVGALAEAHGESDGGAWVAVRAVEQADIALACARNAVDMGHVRPVLCCGGCCGRKGCKWCKKECNGGKGMVRAVGLRHPIIESMLLDRPERYVPNDVSLGCDATGGMLLYGVNAVGKSSVMKAVGLAVVMAQAGMFVACDGGMELAPFTGLYTRVGLRDDIARGHSTFVVEMLELRAILRRADAHSLVIGDELCAGTEAPSALAIVGAAVQSLVARGTPFMFATHLHELVPLLGLVDAAEPQEQGQGQQLAPRVCHMSARHDAASGRLVLDRRLQAGTGPPTYGLEVCRSLDMGDGFMRSADMLRRSVLGIPCSMLAGAARSRYNAAVIVDRCGVCSKAARETHHIVQQSSAPAHVRNRRHNLVPLCSGCHHAVHRGDIRIDGYVATSEGPALDVTFVRNAAADHLPVLLPEL